MRRRWCGEALPELGVLPIVLALLSSTANVASASPWGLHDCTDLVSNDGTVLANAAFWDQHCVNVPNDTEVLEVQMGLVYDVFRPTEGSSWCDMLKSNKKHQWTQDIGTSWPNTWSDMLYADDGLGAYGGSAHSFPQDSRVYVTFWGSENRPGGFGTTAYVASPMGWEKAYTVRCCKLPTSTTSTTETTSTTSNTGTSTATTTTSTSSRTTTTTTSHTNTTTTATYTSSTSTTNTTTSTTATGTSSTSTSMTGTTTRTSTTTSSRTSSTSTKSTTTRTFSTTSRTTSTTTTSTLTTTTTTSNTTTSSTTTTTRTPGSNDNCHELAFNPGNESWGPAKWAELCQVIPNSTDMLKMVMGEVQDFFKPVNGSTYCEMLQAKDKHQWACDNWLTWQEPDWNESGHHLGGSAPTEPYWPGAHSPTRTDERQFLSLWGSERSDKLGGCCATDYTGPDKDTSWGNSFTMYYCGGTTTTTTTTVSTTTTSTTTTSTTTTSTTTSTTTQTNIAISVFNGYITLVVADPAGFVSSCNSADTTCTEALKSAVEGGVAGLDAVNGTVLILSVSQGGRRLGALARERRRLSGTAVVNYDLSIVTALAESGGINQTVIADSGADMLSSFAAAFAGTNLTAPSSLTLSTPTIRIDWSNDALTTGTTTTTTNTSTTTTTTSSTTTSTTSTTTFTRTTTTKTITSTVTSTSATTTSSTTTSTTTLYDSYLAGKPTYVAGEALKAASANTPVFLGGVAVCVIGLLLICCRGRIFGRRPAPDEDGAKDSVIHELEAAPSRGLESIELQLAGFEFDDVFEECEVGGDAMDQSNLFMRVAKGPQAAKTIAGKSLVL